MAVNMSYGWRDLEQAGPTELCDECGFDGRRSRPFDELALVLADLEVEAGHERANERPAADTWSAREYLDHCLDMVGEALVVIREGRPEPRAAVRDLQDAVTQIAGLLHELAGSDLDRVIELGGPQPATPRWMLVHLQHDLQHHQLDIRRGYAKLELEGSDGPTVVR